MHSEFGIGFIFSGLCGAPSALSTSLTPSVVPVAHASPAVWLNEIKLHFALFVASSYHRCRLHRHTRSPLHLVINLCSLSSRHLCALCLGIFAHFPWASLRTFFALSIIEHFTLDIVAHFALDRCALCLGSLSPFVRSLVSIHVLVANCRGLYSPNTEPVLRRPMTWYLLCRVLSLTLVLRSERSPRRGTSSFLRLCRPVAQI
jgi:hypothetical protein